MFDAFPLLYAEEFASAEAVHASFQIKLSLRQRVQRTERLVTRANFIGGPAVGLFGYSYSHNVTLDAISENPDFWISTCFSPDDKYVSACRPASPGDDDPIDLLAERKMLGVRMDGKRVNAFIESYLGDSLQRPIRFEPNVEALTTADRFISSQLSMLAIAPPSELADFIESNGAQHMLESFVEALLLHRQHSHTGFVRRLNCSPGPRDVKRTVDYIHAYAETNPSLDTLARIAGVPGRTLSAHFHDYVGESPVAYIRRVRLQNAREALMSRQAKTVKAAARTQGFRNAGRFSAEYARAFHEPPSETLRRARRR